MPYIDYEMLAATGKKGDTRKSKVVDEEADAARSDESSL